MDRATGTVLAPVAFVALVGATVACGASSDAGRSDADRSDAGGSDTGRLDAGRSLDGAFVVATAASAVSMGACGALCDGLEPAAVASGVIADGVCSWSGS